MRSFASALVVTILLMCVHSHPAIAASDYEDGVRELTQAIRAEAEKLHKQTLAVVDFTDLKGNVTALGRFLAEELSASLVMAGGVQVVDRNQLNKIFKEHELSMLGISDPAAIKKVGKVAGADALVSGSITEMADSVRVTAKVMATDTARVIAAAKTTIPKTGTIAELLKQGIDTPMAQQPEQAPVVSGGQAPKPASSGGMVLIPAGPFLYGEEDKEHRIEISAFQIDIYEVTNAEYAKVRPHDYPSDKAKHPIVNVSWYDAKRFCESVGKRLPTEQEWEKAARGTDGRQYPWGDTYDPKKVNAENRFNGTTPVGQFPNGKSPYGLFDMAGNVWEWTSSDYDNSGQFKVLRGGSWNFAPLFVRSAYRDGNQPSKRLDYFGVRCAKTP